MPQNIFIIKCNRTLWLKNIYCRVASTMTELQEGAAFSHYSPVSPPLGLLPSPPEMPHRLGGEFLQTRKVLLWWHGAHRNRVDTNHWLGKDYTWNLWTAIYNMAEWPTRENRSVSQQNQLRQVSVGTSWGLQILLCQNAHEKCVDKATWWTFFSLQVGKIGKLILSSTNYPDHKQVKLAFESI